MAGMENSQPKGSGGMPEIVVTDPFEKMNGTLGDILAALTGRDPTETQWDLSGLGVARQSQHLRFRCSILVFACDAAAAITLTIGTRTYTFQLPGADTRVVPLGLVIERGTDVILSASAGNVTGYLLGERE